MTHTWEITSASRLTSNGTVTNVDFKCKSDLNNHKTVYNGELTLGEIDISSSNFISYENLTQNIILSWVFENINQTVIEDQNSATITNDIEFLAAQTPTSNGLPWEEN